MISGLGAILTAALPYAQGLVRLLDLASRLKNKPVTEEEVKAEIAKIETWAKSAKEKDLNLFKAAKHGS